MLIVSDPPPVVVMGLRKVKLVPVRLMPAAVLVFKAPLKVVVPVPACCTMEFAVIALADTLLAPAIVKVLSRRPPPRAPLSVILPVPVLTVKF